MLLKYRISMIVLAISFQTLGQQANLVDERDGKIYKIVELGGQIWMAENLAYADHITRASDVSKRVNEIFLKGGKNSNMLFAEVEREYGNFIFCYNDSLKNCNLFGALYTWESAQKSCPNGWRLPSGDELNILVHSAGGNDKKNQYSALIPGGSTGFDGRLTGALFDFGGLDPFYESLDKFGFYWSSTVTSKPDQVRMVQRLILSKLLKRAIINSNRKSLEAAFSVRCVKVK